MGNDYWRNNWLKIILSAVYSLVVLIYGIGLNHYNQTLYHQNYLEIALNPKSLDYLVAALALVLLGSCLLGYLNGCKWQAFDNVPVLITIVGLAILTVIEVVIVIYLIQNPILRAFLVVSLLGVLVVIENN